MSFAPIRKPAIKTYARKGRHYATQATPASVPSTLNNDNDASAQLAEYISKSEMSRRLLKRVRKSGQQDEEAALDANRLSKRLKQSTGTDSVVSSAFQTPHPTVLTEKETLPSSVRTPEEYSPTPTTNRFFITQTRSRNYKENSASRPSSRSRPNSRNQSRTHSRRQSLASPFNSCPGSPKKKVAHKKPVVHHSRALSDTQQNAFSHVFAATQPQEMEMRDPAFFSTGSSPERPSRSSDHIRRPSNPNPQPVYMQELFAQDWLVPAKIVSRPTFPDTPYLEQFGRDEQQQQPLFSDANGFSTPYLRDGMGQDSVDVTMEEPSESVARILSAPLHQLSRDSLFSSASEASSHPHISDLLTADLRPYTFPPTRIATPPSQKDKRCLGTIGDFQVAVAGGSPAVFARVPTTTDSIMDTGGSVSNPVTSQNLHNVLSSLDMDGDEEMNSEDSGCSIVRLPSRTHSLNDLPTSSLAHPAEISASTTTTARNRNRRGTLRASDFAFGIGAGASTSSAALGVGARRSIIGPTSRTRSGTITGPAPPLPLAGRARSGTIRPSKLVAPLPPPPPPPPSVDREMSPFVARLLTTSPSAMRKAPTTTTTMKKTMKKPSPKGKGSKGASKSFTTILDEHDDRGDHSSDDELLMKGHWNESDWQYATGSSPSSSYGGGGGVRGGGGGGKSRVPDKVRRLNNTIWKTPLEQEGESDDELLLVDGMVIE